MKQRKQLTSLTVHSLVMVLLGITYLLNAENFGKSIVGVWGLVAILLALVLLFVAWTHEGNGRVAVLKWSYILFGVMQVPPLACWAMLGGSFEVFGIFVNALVAMGVHIGVLLWSVLGVLALNQNGEMSCA